MADESPELIEQEMQGTRQSLADKVAALEQTVVGTIQSAADTVKETVESVRGAMSDTVDTVKHTVADVKDGVSDSVESIADGIKDAFDVRTHVRDNPFAAVGIAAAAGFLTGWLTGGGRAYGAPPPSHPGVSGVGGFGPSYAAPPRPEPVREREPAKRPGWLDDLLELAGQEVAKLAKQALATATAAAKENIQQGVPKLFERATYQKDEPQTNGGASNVGGFRTGV